METLNHIVSQASDILWGYLLVVLLVGVGLFLTIRLRGIQVFGLRHGTRLTRGLYDRSEDQGDLSHFQALSTALSATVGVGNIAGVAIAIRGGGPGALFWMWVTAAVGMATKFTCCSLAVKYRKINPDGSVSGGPMYYIERGLGEPWKWLAVIFAFLAAFAAFGVGCMAQAGEMARSVLSLFPSLGDRPEGTAAIPAGRFALGALIAAGAAAFTVSLDRVIVRSVHSGATRAETARVTRPIAASAILSLVGCYLYFYLSHPRFGIMGVSLAPTGIGIMIALMTAIVIIGGIKRIGEFTSRLVPFMAIFYVGAALVIIALNAKELPGALALVFSDAFTGTAATGGFAGAGFIAAMQLGVKRGLFSNESGLGSAPIAHATAKTEVPIREGYVALLEPFIDTLIICSMTGLVLILTGAWTTDQPFNGADLTAYAFRVGLGAIHGTVDEARLGRVLVTIGIVLFAYSTAISWSYYGDRAIGYLLGIHAVVPYRFVFCFFLVVGATIKIELVWNLCDILNGCMAIPNLLALILLSGEVKKDLDDYRVRIPDFDRALHSTRASKR